VRSTDVGVLPILMAPYTLGPGTLLIYGGTDNKKPEAVLFEPEVDTWGRMPRDRRMGIGAFEVPVRAKFGRRGRIR